jgi:hypothetical protein
MSPSWRMLPSVIGGPGGCFCLAIRFTGRLLGLHHKTTADGAVDWLTLMQYPFCRAKTTRSIVGYMSTATCPCYLFRVHRGGSSNKNIAHVSPHQRSDRAPVCEWGGKP